jgi:hypothetical protein
MKAVFLTLALLTAPALAEKIKWNCDNVADVQCPNTHNKKLDYCQATNGIDTFMEKAAGRRKVNKCRLSKVVVMELCYSDFEPEKFDLTCEDKEDDQSDQ